MKRQIKKTVAILLLVLFVVTLTASAASAGTSIDTRAPPQEPSCKALAAPYIPVGTVLSAKINVAEFSTDEIAISKTRYDLVHTNLIPLDSSTNRPDFPDFRRPF
jgi:hypothetical protein